jgi:hypothetical protein
LPGTRPPEIEVFAEPAVKEHFANGPYFISVDEILASASDHHDYVHLIADRLMLEEGYVATEACRAYVDARPPEDFSPITAFLSEKLRDRR